MKNRSLLKVLFVVLAAGLMTSCMGLDETDPSSLSVPQVKTFEVKDNGSLVFELSASVDKSASSRIAECGFYYGKDKNMSDAERIECKMTGSSFSADLTLRDYGETYYICSYISNGSGSTEILSDPERVQVKDLEAYVEFGTPEVVSYDRATEKMSVRVSCSPKTGVEVAKWGVCHGKSEKLSVDSNSIEDKNIEDGIINVVIDEVPVGAALFVCPYVYDNGNLAYGDAVCLNAHAVPVVEISEIVDVTDSGASVSASVSDDGGMPIKSRGVVYLSGDDEPTIDTGVTVQVEGEVGEFIVNLSDLAPNQIYSVRAYAQNDKGVTYSEKLAFTTKIGMPQVQTMPVTDIGLTSATLNARIAANGGEAISECGFYLCKGNVFSDDAAVRYACGNSTVSFSYAVTGLEQATEYCYKAFVVNSVGESVGEPICFTTEATIEYALTVPDDTSVRLTGVVVAVSTRGFLISDDSGNILYVYAGKDWVRTVDVKDVVLVKGTMTTYNGNRELAFESVDKTSSVSTLPQDSAYQLTADNIGEFASVGRKPCKVTAEGRYFQDGTYYNLTVGADPVCISIAFSTIDLRKYVGANMRVTGYYLYTTTSESKTIVTIMMTDVDVEGDLAMNSGSANSYIVSEPGVYFFPAVKGNSTEPVGSVNSVDVLWESFGTDVTPSVGDLVQSVSYAYGYISFQTPTIFNEGNAVIAAKDASGKILWSWHIWFTDAPGVCYYRNVDGAMMDRNLGATSATPGEAGALGLLYQWGRKDPFLGSSSISSDVEAKSTISWPSPVSSSSSRGTIGYALEHPTTFIIYNNSNYDWYYTGSSSTDNTRWQSEKTLYDPCPAGWRVPDGGSNGVWNKAGFDDQSYDSSNEGMLFGSGISSPATWYPASGCRYDDDESLYGVGSSGYYWSVTPNGYGTYNLDFDDDGNVYPLGSSFRAYGQSVRCLQE